LLELEERRDPDSFEGEYLAEFFRSGDALLQMDRFTAPERDWPLPVEEIAPPIIVGLDPALLAGTSSVSPL
jgi:hypothetical protein